METSLGVQDILEKALKAEVLKVAEGIHKVVAGDIQEVLSLAAAAVAAAVVGVQMVTKAIPVEALMDQEVLDTKWNYSLFAEDF